DLEKLELIPSENVIKISGVNLKINITCEYRAKYI
ncbi:phage tail family protein, partial [Bacillus anthracis]|nr:phage tail family protein [Bacillus anthracis]